MLLNLFYQQYPHLTYLFISVLGLIVGSFLNVIIVRYPIMLTQTWRKNCLEFLHQSTITQNTSFNLCIPRSQCPHCKKTLQILHTIPLFSYIGLRGKCAFCQSPISLTYPFIELLTAGLTLIVFIKFALSLQTLAAWGLTWALITMAVIDIKTQLLPDSMTLSMLWLGLLISLANVFCMPSQAILGAMGGYTVLFIVNYLFTLIRKKPGMGHGDFKMLAMLGAWFGIALVFNILLLAVLISLIVGLTLLLTGRIHRETPLPFGPFLAIAGWSVMVFAPTLKLWI